MFHPTVVVTIGESEVLRLEGSNADVLVAPFEVQGSVVVALAQAIAVFMAHQPAPSPLATAAEAVEKLAGLADPAVAHEGRAAVGAAITDFRNRINASAASRISH